MLDFAPDRVRKRQFWGVLSSICGRYQLKANFLNTLWCSRKLGSGEEFAHAGEKAEVSIKIVRNAEPVIERVRGQL
jgi:hypothetical protein